MKPVKLIVTEQHRSEYPRPITFVKGAHLRIGEKYVGDEGWDNWYFCSMPDQEAGWVPGQVIEWMDRTAGIAKEDYSAKELDVDVGEIIWGTRELNGWVWCASQKEEGWVPLSKVREVNE